MSVFVGSLTPHHRHPLGPNRHPSFPEVFGQNERFQRGRSNKNPALCMPPRFQTSSCSWPDPARPIHSETPTQTITVNTQTVTSGCISYWFIFCLLKPMFIIHIITPTNNVT